MVRPEYWDRSKELIEYCNEDELKVLSQQADKALNRRMAAYLGKVDAVERKKKKARQMAVKNKFKSNKER